MIKHVIDAVFAACCGMMYGMADMFGRTYEYVNVVLFCYVEPLLTVLMILGALYALFRLPKFKAVAETCMWLGVAVAVLTGVLLMVSAIHAWGMVDIMNITQAEINAVQASILKPDPDPAIHELFQKTMHWLMDTSRGNMGYNALNLLIYVLLMPVLIVASIFICRRAARKAGR